VCTKQDQLSNKEILQVLETSVAWNTHICKIGKINFWLWTLQVELSGSCDYLLLYTSL